MRVFRLAVVLFLAVSWTAQAEESKDIVVDVDVAKLEHDQQWNRKLYVSVPAGVALKLKLKNLVPGTSYTVTQEDGQDVAEITTQAVSPQAAGYSCRTLSNLTTTLAKARQEREVSPEVSKILEEVKACDDATFKSVQAAIDSSTSGTFTISSIAPGSSKLLTIKRKDEKTWNSIEVSTCTPETPLKAYLEKNYKFAKELQILALDHKLGTWTAYKWDGTQLTELEEEFYDLSQIDNRIQLSLQKNHEKAVFVVNTNPLLYRLSATSAAETPIPQIADLQQLVGLLSNFAVTGVGLSQGFQSLEIVSDAAEGAGPGFLPATFDPEALALLQSLGLPEPDADETRIKAALKALNQPPYNEIREIALSIAPILWVKSKEIEVVNGSFDQAAESLKGKIQELDHQTNSLKARLQVIEQGVEPVESLATSSTNFVSEIDTKYSDLQKARNSLTGIKAHCIGSLKKLEQALDIKLQPLPAGEANQGERKGILRKYRELLGELTGAKLRSDKCDQLESGGARLDTQIPPVAVWLMREGNHPTTAEPDDATKILFKPIRQAAIEYQRMAAGLEERIKSGGEIASKRGAVTPQAAAIQQLFKIQAAHMMPPNPKLDNPTEVNAAICSLRKGLLVVTPLAGQELAPEWTTIHSEDFMVKPDPVLKEGLVLDHPVETTGKYAVKTKSKWADFDVTFGLTYTDLAEPSWSASPAPTTTTSAVSEEDPMTTPPTPKFITKTGEDSRAGEVGLFVSWPIFKLRNWSLGPQIGAGLNTDHPAVFLGGALGWRKNFRINFGGTTQLVKELAGQNEGDPVADDSAIKTRDGLDTSWYVGVSISIGNLPFFKPAEKK